MVNWKSEKGSKKGTEETWPDVKESNWVFGEVEESTVTHEFKINKDEKETLTKYIPEPLW